MVNPCSIDCLSVTAAAYKGMNSMGPLMTQFWQQAIQFFL